MFAILHYKLWAKSLIIVCKHLETTQSYSNIFVKNQDLTRPLWNSRFFWMLNSKCITIIGIQPIVCFPIAQMHGLRTHEG